MLSPESVNVIPKVQCDDIVDDEEEEMQEAGGDAASTASASQPPEPFDKRLRLSNLSMLSRHMVHDDHVMPYLRRPQATETSSLAHRLALGDS